MVEIPSRVTKSNFDLSVSLKHKIAAFCFCSCKEQAGQGQHAADVASPTTIASCAMFAAKAILRPTLRHENRSGAFSVHRMTFVLASTKHRILTNSPEQQLEMCLISTCKPPTALLTAIDTEVPTAWV